MSSPTIASGIALSSNKSYLAFEDVVRIVIEPDNETGHHFHSVTLNLLHRFEQVSAILRLLRFFETLFNWSFNSKKDPAKTCPLHFSQKSLVIREINARLSQEGKWKTISFLPFGHFGSRRLTFFLLPMKLSSTMKTVPRHPRRKSASKLRQHLLIAFCARYAPVNLDDVTEFTVEGAAARILN